VFGGGGTGIENGLNLGPSVAGGMGVFVGGGGTDEERGGGERVAGEGAVAHCVVGRAMGEEETLKLRGWCLWLPLLLTSRALRARSTRGAGRGSGAHGLGPVDKKMRNARTLCGE
jgi:hypothetical protein